MTTHSTDATPGQSPAGTAPVTKVSQDHGHTDPQKPSGAQPAGAVETYTPPPITKGGPGGCC